MAIHVNGIIQTENGYAVKNFMEPAKQPIVLGKLVFPDYQSAVRGLSNRYFPQSYKEYLLAAEGMEPDSDTWNNLMFAGHACGYYDHEQRQFRNVRDLDMGAASDAEVAYVEALGATYKSLCAMVEK